MNGINVKYSLDKDYFKVGEAYSLHLGTNKFRVGLLVKYSEESVTFKILEGEDLIDLTLTLNELRHNNYGMVKMKPDHMYGTFSNR